MTIAYTAASASPGWSKPNYTTLPSPDSFTSVNGGTQFPAASKVILIFSIASGDLAGPEPAFNLGTSGGTAFTKAVGSFAATGSGGTAVEIWWADAASATTDTIVYTGTANSYQYIGLIVGYLTGAATGAPSSTTTVGYPASAAPSSAVTVPSGGICIAGLTLGNASAGTPPYTVTWTGATQVDTKSFPSFTLQNWGATATSSGTISTSASVLAFESGMVTASWGPGSSSLTGSLRFLSASTARAAASRNVSSKLSSMLAATGKASGAAKTTATFVSASAAEGRLQGQSLFNGALRALSSATSRLSATGKVAAATAVRSASVGRSAPTPKVSASARGASAAKAQAGYSAKIAAAVRFESASIGRASYSAVVAAAARSLSVSAGRFLGGFGNVVFASLRSVSVTLGKSSATGKTTASIMAMSASAAKASPAPKVSAFVTSISASRGNLVGSSAAFVFATLRSASSAAGRLVGSKFSFGALRSSSGASARISGVGSASAALRALSAALGRAAANPPVILFADPRFVSAMPFRITASTIQVNMPQGPDFSLMDVGETITGAMDFSRWLPPGVTIASVVSVMSANVPSGTDGPYIRIIGNPSIGVAPWITGGSGIAGTAVLQQWRGAAVGTARVTMTILTSDGQTLNGYAHQQVSTPN